MLLGLFWLLSSSLIVQVLGVCYRNCESCHTVRPDVLNVHIVPHTHLDVGWIKTFDEYYWGTKTRINKSGVRYIIESIIIALLQNSKRRFIFVETAYLQKWWSLANEVYRSQLKKLVHDGQLEIVGGGWTMNDEACTNYQAIIDQLTLGLKFLNETLGVCGLPKTAWQVDTFGHSREMASILSQMGYDGIFIGRVDYRDKLMRFKSKTAEMIWQGSPSLGDNSNIFVSIVFNGYLSPSPFCFDAQCNDDSIVDDIDSQEYNFEDIVSDFAEYVKVAADHYTSNHLLIAMGGDFYFEDALRHFNNLDKLIEGFKVFNHSYHGRPINVLYSTPNCYLRAVNKKARLHEISYIGKSDDFFPYASDTHSFWTGFYTSRPTSKRFERDSNNILQVAKQLSSFLPQIEDHINDLKPMQEAMAIMQHHDAITGTETQHVADEYHKMLTVAFQKNVKQASNMLSVLLPLNPLDNVDLQLNYCLYANVSICKLSQDEDFLVAVYNPLSFPVSYYVRLPVNNGCFTILSPDDEEIPYDIFPAIDEFAQYEDHNPARYELVFYAQDLPPLGLKVYAVELNKRRCKSCVEPDMTENRHSLGDTINGFEVDESTGFLCSATLNGASINLKQEFMYYLSARGDNSACGARASGAYVFRPSADSKDAIRLLDNIQTTTYRGALVDELHQIISPWIKQVVRVYRKTNHLEFDWLVGPIDIKDYAGKEVISRFSTELNTDDVFYTDSNSREMLRRRRNCRPTFELNTKEGISSNYYPVSSKIALKDEDSNMEFAVITDRSQGGSSLGSGQIELMVHRRLLNDDGLGVSEELNERQFDQGLIARGKHYVTFGPRFGSKKCPPSAVVQRGIMQSELMRPMSFLMESTNLRTLLSKEISGLSRPLPRNVQILTLEPWRPSESTLLLRLEHIYEAGEDPILARPVAVCLDGLFMFFDVIWAEEMTLGANRPLRCYQRLPWCIGGNLEDVSSSLYSRNVMYTKRGGIAPDFAIELNPMEIRTFILTVTYK